MKNGDVCQTLFFSISGNFYQYTLSEDIFEQIIDLHLENEWFLNEQSFIAQKPSKNTIKSFSGGEIIELSINALHTLIGQSPAFFQLASVLEQSKDRLHFFDNNLTPSEKYKYILENKPKLIQAFPLKYIASFLKITPETLSRVRESLAKQRK